MESRLLDILVCPLCKSPLRHDRRQKELICRADKLAFPIRDGVPIMLESEARELDLATESAENADATAASGAQPAATEAARDTESGSTSQ